MKSRFSLSCPLRFLLAALLGSFLLSCEVTVPLGESSQTGDAEEDEAEPVGSRPPATLEDGVAGRELRPEELPFRDINREQRDLPNEVTIYADRFVGQIAQGNVFLDLQQSAVFGDVAFAYADEATIDPDQEWVILQGDNRRVYLDGGKTLLEPETFETVLSVTFEGELHTEGKVKRQNLPR